MVNINEAFPSNWIGADDLKGADITLVINKSSVQDLGQAPNTDRKLCIWFNGTEKGMTLNVINRNTIIDLYGPETDNWHGESITIYPTTTEWQGKMVPCVRVRTEKPRNSNAALPTTGQTAPYSEHEVRPPDPVHAPVSESDIPF